MGSFKGENENEISFSSPDLLKIFDPTFYKKLVGVWGVKHLTIPPPFTRSSKGIGGSELCNKANYPSSFHRGFKGAKPFCGWELGKNERYKC